MGSIVENGGLGCAPTVSDSTVGTQPWSGKHQDKLTADDVMDIIEFCRIEAYRRGWNDYLYSRVGVDESNIFDKRFACGLPHESWKKHYVIGVYESAEQKGDVIDPLVSMDDMPEIINMMKRSELRYGIRLENYSSL